MTRSPIQNKAGNRHSLVKITDDELISLRAGLNVEMSKQNIAFSVGGVGERLVIEHLRKTSGLPKLQAAPRGTKNLDALSRNGDRYSIKTVCNAKKPGTFYPDADDRDKPLFEYVLTVKLAKDGSLEPIHQLGWNDFEKVRSWDKRMNVWYVAVSQRTLGAAQLIYQAPVKNG